MGKLKYECKLLVGKLFRLFHQKQFPRETVFFGIPQLIRPDRLACGEGLKVNDHVFINADGGVKIGKDVTLSYGVTILAAAYDKEQFFQGKRIHKNRGIIIGNNVWIGANATIIDGTYICDHVIIGAGAVVTKDIREPYSVYAGIPAKKISS